MIAAAASTATTNPPPPASLSRDVACSPVRTDFASESRVADWLGDGATVAGAARDGAAIAVDTDNADVVTNAVNVASLMLPCPLPG